MSRPSRSNPQGSYVHRHLEVGRGVHVFAPRNHPSQPDLEHVIDHRRVVHDCAVWLNDCALANILQLAVHEMQECARCVLWENKFAFS